MSRTIEELSTKHNRLKDHRQKQLHRNLKNIKKMSDSEKSNEEDLVEGDNNKEEEKPKPAKKVVPPELPLEWTQMGEGATSEAMPIRYPEDVADIFPEELDICIVGTAGQKITVMSDDFYKKCNPNLESLVLRSHLIKYIKGIQGFGKLELLELYDNQLQELSCLEVPGPNLRVLDMSYNAIRDMSPVSVCVNLTELCKKHIYHRTAYKCLRI